MPLDSTALTPALLAAHRLGRECFVAVGLAVAIPARRPSGYLLARSAAPRARAQVGAGGKASVTPPAPAIVQVRGVLSQRASLWDCGEGDGYDAIEQRACDALSDPRTSSLVLDLDSPGGDGPGLEQCIGSIRRLADALGKPVLGYVNELAASAGLWLLAGTCDAVHVPPSGHMGSVGCVVPAFTEARKLRREGTDVYIARAPAGKMRPNPVEGLDPIGKARVDAMAAEGEARFVAALSSRLGIAPAQIRAWNGDIFSGEAARGAGLAQGVAVRGLGSVVALAAEEGAQRRAA